MSQARLTKWVAGFFDGEGCLRTTISERANYDTGHGFHESAAIEHSYLGGFFDAEGCVAFNIIENGGCGVGFEATPEANIFQKNSNNLESLLTEFAEGIGVDSNTYHKEKRPHGESDTFVWQVSNRAGVEKLLVEIRPYCVVKGQEIDVFLEEILPRLKQGYQSNRRQFLELVAWKDVMDSHKGGTRGKYSLGYFEDLWGMSLEPGRLPDAHPKKKGTPMGDPP